jgi:uncharacterized delta-60 repeat protein
MNPSNRNAHRHFIGVAQRTSCYFIIVFALLLLGSALSFSHAATVPAAGSVDETFVFPQAVSSVERLALLPNGGFIVGCPSQLLRLNPDGTQDLSFVVNTSTAGREIVVTTNGHVICLTGSGLLGFNPDGSVEFNSPSIVAPSGSMRHLRITSDNKLIIAGVFTSVYGTARPGVARLNAKGTLDESFTPTGVNYGIEQIAVAPDGSVLLASQRTNSEPSLLRRLTSTGSPDATFNTGTGDFNITRMEVMTNLQIYVGGEFKTYNDYPVRSLVRLNSDGSLDTNFLFTPLHAKGVYSIRAQRDGKILLATGSVMSNGVAGVVRINTNGTHDTNFIPAMTTSSPRDVAELPDGKVLAAGMFFVGTNESRRVLVRLHSESLGLELWNDSARVLRLFGPAGRSFVLESTTTLLEWQSILTNTFTSESYVYSNAAPILPASQFYRARLVD